MSIRIHSEAQDDTDEAARWYESRQAGLGADVLDEIHKVFRLIEAHPQIGQRVSRTPPGREVRCFLAHRFPYAVVYEVLGNDVFVLAVAHTSLRRQSWRRRLP